MNPFQLDVPDRIDTPRLILRVPKPGDGEPIASSVRESLPELKQWMPWASDGYNVENAEDWCRRMAANFILRTETQYSIYNRDGAHGGSLGAFQFDWNIPGCVIGYWLRTSWCGQGLMAEAVNALTAMLFTRMHMKRIQLHCGDLNVRSSRLAERCGFRLDGVIRLAEKAHTGELRNTRTYSKLADDKD